MCGASLSAGAKGGGRRNPLLLAITWGLKMSFTTIDKEKINKKKGLDPYVEGGALRMSTGTPFPKSVQGEDDCKKYQHKIPVIYLAFRNYCTLTNSFD